jgi:hypothetical protein
VELVGKFDGRPGVTPARLPTAPDNLARAIWPDHEFWDERYDDLHERFEAWLKR